MPVPSVAENVVTFISGIGADGRVAAISYQTWSRTGDPTLTSSYNTSSGAMKWGGGAAGTGGAVTYGFDPASNWTTVERDAFIASMKLWEAVANIDFVASDPGGAQLLFTRLSNGGASGTIFGRFVPVDSATLGTARQGAVRIDPSGNGFGPLGQPLADQGGYPWMTILHEIGHAIGLGHAGAYDVGLDRRQNGGVDNLAYTVMSYFNPADSGIPANWGGLNGVPVTPMQLDIYAIQRLYGRPADSPLNGDVVFGFNSTIQGDIRQFFDFSINSRPIVTLWGGGQHNVLDLTGFSMASTVNMRAGLGNHSSVGGLTHNLYIAEDTFIETARLGSGDDLVSGNDGHNNITGGAGADRIFGNGGNDHLYGGGTTQTPGDGADEIAGGDGSDYLQGNAGGDTLNGDGGSDRIQGGAGNDSIGGDQGNDTVNGNLGNDSIDGGSENDSIRGGQGDDVINGGFGTDFVLGDLGDDRIGGGPGIDFATGGAGADIFVFTGFDAEYEDQPGFANAFRFDEVLDFQDGIDRFDLDMGIPSRVVALGVQASGQAAAVAAAALLGGADNVAANYTQLVTASVGGDAYLFWALGPAMSGVKVNGVAVDGLTAADFI